jgi:hypothetical protein
VGYQPIQRRKEVITVPEITGAVLFTEDPVRNLISLNLPF